MAIHQPDNWTTGPLQQSIKTIILNKYRRYINSEEIKEQWKLFRSHNSWRTKTSIILQLEQKYLATHN